MVHLTWTVGYQLKHVYKTPQCTQGGTKTSRHTIYRVCLGIRIQLRSSTVRRSWSTWPELSATSWNTSIKHHNKHKVGQKTSRHTIYRPYRVCLGIRIQLRSSTVRRSWSTWPELSVTNWNTSIKHHNVHRVGQKQHVTPLYIQGGTKTSHYAIYRVWQKHQITPHYIQGETKTSHHAIYRVGQKHHITSHHTIYRVRQK